MFALDILDWVQNWFWDTFDEIFVQVFDHILYSLVGFLYKCFIILGTMDIFGGNGSGNESALAMYQAFTTRIYSVLGVVMVFVLAYQLILFIIDPDKGAKESSKLIKNLVKAIILVIVCPLLFHYAALVQQHILNDNTIWSIVLGTGATSNDDAISAGNSMAGMVYMTMFHPAGTTYSDFYDADGMLKDYDTACSNYEALYAATDADKKYMSDRSMTRAAKWGLTGTLFAGSIGGLAAGTVGLIVDGATKFWKWITGQEDPKYTSCQKYWIDLYYADGGKKLADDDDPTDMSKYDMSSLKKIGHSNSASVITADVGLIDEIRDEGTMEYFYAAPLVGIILVWMLVAYSLDMAYRAFKLAFLEMIAPIPILIGVIPKKEEMFKKWLNLLIKTYIDVFVRTFVMAFTVFMIQLVPTFTDALFVAFTDIVSGAALLKAAVIVFLVLGLLRFAKELPGMIKEMSTSDLFKNIDPRKSYKATAEAVKPIGKLAGGAAGAALGGIAGARAMGRKIPKVHGAGYENKNFIGKRLDDLQHMPQNIGRSVMQADAFRRGTKKGAQTGYADGFGLKSAAHAMTNVNESTNDLYNKSQNLKSALFKDDKFQIGGVSKAIDQLTGGSLKKFKTAWNGDVEAKRKNDNIKAAQAFDSMGRAGQSFIASTSANNAAEIQQAKSNALESITQNAAGTGYTAKFNGADLTGNSLNEIRQKISDAAENEQRTRDIEAFKKVFDGTDGMKIFQAYARNHSKKYIEHGDALTDSQRKEITKTLESVFGDANNQKATELRNLLGNGVDYTDLSSVMDALGKADLGGRYDRLSDAEKNRVGESIATLMNDISTADVNIANSGRMLINATEGAKANAWTGRIEDSIAPTVEAPKPSGNDNKGENK